MHGLIFETSVCYWQNQPGCYLSERDMLALYVEMRFENKLRSDVMRYQIWSSNRNSIRMQIHARHNLVRRKGFLCQVSPRFPIVFNAWLVQMHFSMSKLNLIVSDESPSKVQTKCSFWMKKRSSWRWVCTGKENYCDQQFQSIIFFVEDNWMDLHWSSFSDMLWLYPVTGTIKTIICYWSQVLLGSSCFSPALCQQFAVCRGLCWLECHFRFLEKVIMSTLF